MKPIRTTAKFTPLSPRSPLPAAQTPITSGQLHFSGFPQSVSTPASFLEPAGSDPSPTSDYEIWYPRPVNLFLKETPLCLPRVFISPTPHAAKDLSVNPKR